MARVVVIEDDADTRRFLEEWLSLHGHQVALGSDGEEGVGKVRESPPDLVITDLFMPNQEGLETIQELRRDFPAIPVIAVSGNVIAETMLAVALKMGASGVLQKPFNGDELIALIERLLRSSSMQPVQLPPSD